MPLGVQAIIGLIAGGSTSSSWVLLIGVVTLGTAGLMRPAMAAGYDRPFTWISPRGTLEVLDDYAYWVAKKYGYFGDLSIDIQPGPSDGTATVKFVDVGQADMGFPSPGVFSFAIAEGMALKSVFHEAARLILAEDMHVAVGFRHGG